MSGGIKRFLPNNQYRAAVGANNPSAINPFATIDDLNSGDIEYNLDPNGVVGSHDFQIGGNDLKLKSITAETTACSLEVSGVPLSINDTVPAWSVITAVFTANELSVVKFEIL